MQWSNKAIIVFFWLFWIVRFVDLNNNSFPLTDEEHIIEYDKLSGFLWDYSPNGYSFLLCENICKDIRKIPSHSFIKMLHKNSFGALETDKYFLDCSLTKKEKVDLTSTYQNIAAMYNNKAFNKEQLYKLNCSLNGNTPKICVTYENDDLYMADEKLGNQWIVKIPWEEENRYYGIGEYLCSKLADLCGIDLPKYKLLESNHGIRYFAAKRFDRSTRGKELTISLCALVNKFFRFGIDEIGYVLELIKTKITDEAEIFKIFQLMCFFIKIGNEDLSSLNISFIYDTDTNVLKLAPAYDLSPFRGINELPENLYWKDNIKNNIALLEAGTKAGLNPQRIKAYIIKVDNILKTYTQLRNELLANC